MVEDSVANVKLELFCCMVAWSMLKHQNISSLKFSNFNLVNLTAYLLSLSAALD